MGDGLETSHDKSVLQLPLYNVEPVQLLTYLLAFSDLGKFGVIQWNVVFSDPAGIFRFSTFLQVGAFTTT